MPRDVVAQRIAQRRYEEKNRAARNAAKREWELRNREKVSEYRRRWAAENRDAFNAGQRRYRARNLLRMRRYSAKYRDAEGMAAPQWANRFFIEEIYDLARLRTRYLGQQHHVDHIVPLQSDLVCGLHVENNLRVVTATENCKKGNRDWPDKP